MDYENEHDIKVFIEEEIVPELKLKDEVLLDVAIGEVYGEKIGMLFIKKTNNVYS